MTDKKKFGLMPCSFVQASLPYSARAGREFIRRAGKYRLILYSPDGLPYGSIPRLVMSWMTTEAVKTHSRTLYLGDSLSAFLEELGLHRTGGPRGDITRLRRQIDLLFGCFISLRYEDDTEENGETVHRKDIRNMVVADEAYLMWQPKKVGGSVFSKKGKIPPSIVLSETFFNEITSAPVPVDLRALRQLRKAPMAIDLFVWLSYRLSYLKKPVKISWEQLSVQFGSNYARTRAFKEAFLGHMEAIRFMTNGISYKSESDGFTLYPSDFFLRDDSRSGDAPFE